MSTAKISLFRRSARLLGPLSTSLSDILHRFTPIDGQDQSQPLPYNPADPIPKQITTSVQKSLANLHTTYLDSYLLHSPFATWKQTLEAWNTLAALQDAGTVRLIGVSNTYSAAMVLRLSAVRAVQVVQNRWFEGNGWDADVRAVCRDKGIMYQYACF